MFKNRQNLLVVTSLVILVALGLFLGLRQPNTKADGAVAGQSTEQPSQVSSIRYAGVEGKTALDLLQVDNKAQVDKSDYGSYVVEINGIKNSDSQFWMFYVNGELSSVGADQYQTKSSDQIEWKYENIQL